MIIGTAGHIDHGKSSLVKAITGTDPDRLKEEKARGITIDLGFATWKQPDGSTIGFVDVPGHERFVHTMLAGAHGIDRVLLVVAADDGVMPQTREHLAIVSLLGLDDAVVALTKSDLADAARLAAATAEIASLLAPTPFRGAPILPVSSVTGAGMAALQAALAAPIAIARPTDRRFRLAVDRSFSIAGAGTVVTGTILSGQVAVGDRVVVSPSGLEARVRGLQRHNRPAERAAAGDRCALNLAGPDISKDAIARGEMVLDPALHAPAQRIDASVTVLAAEKKGLSTWMPVRVHIGAAEIMGRVVPLGETLAPGRRGFVQLVLDHPVAAAVGDRVVLRDTTASRTIGGGVILDLRAPERRRRAPERLALLAALDGAATPREIAACAPYVIDLDAFARDRALVVAPDEGLVRLGTLALDQGIWSGLRRDIAAVLAAHHAENPDLQGMAIDRLRQAITPRLAVPAFRAVLVALEDVIVQGAWAHLPGHVARLAPEDEALWQRIAPGLGGEVRFRPPRVRDFANALGAEERRIRAVLKAVARRGEIDQVAHDHFFLRATVAEMARFAAALGAAGSFAAAEFRDFLGEGTHNAGRKVAIQVLEFFDRHGMTVRREDARRIDSRRIHMFDTAPAGADGRESPPVGRPDFKSGWGRKPASGGFNSHSLPPGAPS